MKTPNQIYEQFVDVGNSQISIEKAIKAAQKGAWDEAVKACAKNAVTKEAKVWYTGVRAGRYTTATIIDRESILEVKKLFKEGCQSG